MNEYDIVIVGGGHNGLTCGCYLAKAGQKVGVFERRHNIGGGCCTEEVTLPGFKHNLHNFIHAWIHTGPVYKELELEKYGSKYVYPETQWGMVYEDGKALVQYLDVDSTCKELGKFSKKDAREYRDLIRYFEDMKDIIFGALFAPPLPPSVLDGLLEGTKEGLEFLKLMKSNPKTLCNDIFESEQIKAWALFCTTQGGTPHDIYGNGIYLPAVFCLTHIKPYGMSVGGSRMLAEGMTKCLEDHGGKVFKNTHVSKIIVENGNATGLELADGTKIKAKVVVSNTEPQQTLLNLV
ncbi:MAG: NAD(P)/FAD-dependent oxidoreductase, partial [Thermodesulfobacteriota bacterium]|nr:NAD(P)/FAD-dependent oxidoreductase [Thermodesulfobacteriota bacterium]